MKFTANQVTQAAEGLPLAIVDKLAQVNDGEALYITAKDGFKAIRIPSVVVTKAGSVLAFAEARQSLGDQSQNKIAMKRSTDGGRTWSAIRVLHDDGVRLTKLLRRAIDSSLKTRF